MHRGLGGGELDAVVDAHDLVFRRQHHDGLLARRARQGDHVGQVEFLLGVVVTYPLQQGEGLRARDGHDARVAEGDFALGFRSVFLLADGDELAPLAQQAAIARGVARLEAQHGYRCARLQGAAQGGVGLGPDEGRVGENHQQLAAARSQGLARPQGRMGGAKPFALFKNLRSWREPHNLRAHIRAIRSHDHRQPVGAGLHDPRQHMGQHGAPRNRVQDLGTGGFHAGSLACGEDHGEAIGRFRHVAVISGSHLDWCKRCDQPRQQKARSLFR